MSYIDLSSVCPICKHHLRVRDTIDLRFHQMTDKGRVACCVAVPSCHCPRCGFKVFDAGADAIMDEAVRQEYDKLPPTSGAIRHLGLMSALWR